MELIIDGRKITVQPEESLLDMVKRLGLMKGNLTEDPIAAKIAGEVFTLHYVPLRLKDVQPEQENVRAAMAYSDGHIKLLRYSDPRGRDAYGRTAQFVLFYALEKLWPEAQSQTNCIVGAAMYVKVGNAPDFDAGKLKAYVQQIVEADFPLRRKRITTREAIEHYTKRGQPDKARLLTWRAKETFDVYTHDDFADYFYGEMAPSTGFLRNWDIIPAPEGFMFVYPDPLDPEKTATYREMPKFFDVYVQGKEWCHRMDCRIVADLNELVCSGKIRELIRVNEALHEKRYSQVADMICQRDAKVVMLAGPSSSGKTTSANRLAVQLRVHGKKPILMSLDDYYIDRDKITPGPDGKIDLEHINTIDTDLFSQHLAQLIRGEEVELPSFNFKLQRRVWNGHKLRLHADSVIIVEGLHALNPVLLPKDVDLDRIFKMYVSPLLPLNLDDHNRIPTSYLRLLRRIVRDFESRGASVHKTLSMWDSVRRGEERWIFPFQENADIIFNSSTLYELPILKRHIFPLLQTVEVQDEYYDEVRAIVKVLNFICEADVDNEIPPTSLVREFIGGNTFYL